jgi:protein SCO1/2
MVKGVINNLFVLLAALLVLGSCTEAEEIPEVISGRVLPIVGERDLEYRMVDGKEVVDTIYHHVPEFDYLNQDSIMISSKDLKGKIWVVDFFFSNCPSICPPMTFQMNRLSNETKDLKEYIQFLSFSIDPKNDTPIRLREYIKMKEITASNWEFLTGKEKTTHLLAEQFFNGAERDDDVAGGFGHTPHFALVDREGLVRGVYNGTLKEHVDKLNVDLRKLLKYEYGVTESK